VRAGMSYAEIAAVLGTSEEAARVAVFDARRRLVRILAPFLEPRSDRAAKRAAT
jgi:DNA-directed RNA polymerase specialized sigma24 family protein